MSMRVHHYAITLDWTGDRGSGTSSYAGYARDHVITAGDKPSIAGSSDPHFLGDPTRWNPEELLVASLSACHQLWYLHLCARADIRVLAYRDTAEGEMEEAADGAGRFTRVLLSPRVVIAAGGDPHRAHALHAEAARFCFIARSVAFPVEHAPVIEVAAAD